MQLIAFVAGVSQLLFGEMIIGIATLLALAAITLPAFFTRGAIRSVPIEFELIFITMVMLQFVIGETLNFYTSFPYYDRFIHFSLPMFVGFLSFLTAYTLHEMKLMNLSTPQMVVAIIFMTLGVGAAWEILEYLSDVFLSSRFHFIPHLQGSVIESAHIDTMRDLITDLAGGVIGALLGLRYINSQSSTRKTQLGRIVREWSVNFKKS